MSFINIYAQHKDDIVINPPTPKQLNSPVETPMARNLNPTGLWSEAGNYTVNWSGLTGSWVTDQPLYDSITDYVVTSAEDLAAFTRLINLDINYTFLDKVITITADIDLGAHYWDVASGDRDGPINNFSGRLEGQGFTICNLIVDYDSYDVSYIFLSNQFGGFGLFSYLYGAKIRNLTFENPRIILGEFAPDIPIGVDCVAGQASNSLLENITIVNGVIGQLPSFGLGCYSCYFGGLVGVGYNPFAGNVPQNLPNAYLSCTVNGLSISYTEEIDQNWRFILGFGGIVGGDFPDGFDPDAPFQARIDLCTVNNLSITRGPGLDRSFMYECYGGIKGFCIYPILINECAVSSLLIDLNNTATVNGSTFGEVGPATFMAGGIVGFGVNDNPQGVYTLSRCSAAGTITATAPTPNLFPVYVGGLFGYHDDPSFDTQLNYTNFDFTALRTNKTDTLIYGNLFWLLLAHCPRCGKNGP